MNATQPKVEQLEALARDPATGPLSMLKSLKLPGGSLLFRDTTGAFGVGDEEHQWNFFAMMQSPSVRHFIDMIQSLEYEETHIRRATGLGHLLLVSCNDPA